MSVSEIKRTKGCDPQPLKVRGIAAAARALRDGMSWSALVEQLQVDFQVSRSTAARWIRTARQDEIRSTTDIDQPQERAPMQCRKTGYSFLFHPFASELSGKRPAKIGQ